MAYMMVTGIVLAIVAMLSWGLGDFLIQRSTRKIGDWETLFFITAFGALVLLPFSYSKIIPFFTHLEDGGLIFLFASVILLVAAIVNFEALRKGKLAIVEPIWSLEIPMTAVLAFFLLNEKVSVLEIVLIAILIIFLVLVAFREKRFTKKLLLEKGVILALLGAVLMGSANFFIGWGARVTDPIFINFITDSFLAIFAGIIIIGTSRVARAKKDFKNNIALLLPMSIADKIAWLAFAFAVTLAPMAISTALSQSYIIVAVVLGMAVNKEKLHVHQKVGMVGAIITAVILAVVATG